MIGKQRISRARSRSWSWKILSMNDEVYDGMKLQHIFNDFPQRAFNKRVQQAGRERFPACDTKSEAEKEIAINIQRLFPNSIPQADSTS